MSRHNYYLVLAFFSICFIFSGAVLYCVRQARVDAVEGHKAASAFYALLQKRDFVAARSMLTRERQGALSIETLKTTWDKFEKKHGRLVKWEPAHTPTIYGNRVSIFPRYVEESRLLTGTRGKAGAGLLQMQPEDGTWKVARISIVP